jgi:hypothetical protein
MLSNNKILFIQNPAANALVTGSAASHIIGKLKRSSNQAAGYNFRYLMMQLNGQKLLLPPTTAMLLIGPLSLFPQMPTPITG